MTQSEMLLVQPLNLDEINLKLKDEEEVEKEQVKLEEIVIDDVELLAILGMPSLCNTAMNSPVDEQGILDWDDMPQLCNENKRKREESEDEDFDIFAQFVFVDAILPPVNKKPFVQETNNISSIPL
jgi:Mrp family chromosome partitioning ATPase